MRQCSLCKQFKSRTDFYLVSKRTGTLRGDCKVCRLQKTNVWAKQHRPQLKIIALRHARLLRKRVIEIYGGSCNCCAEIHFSMLDLDHVNGSGHQERRLRRGGNGFKSPYRKVFQAGYPLPEYQLLCSNCNASKARNGGWCEHEFECIRALLMA